MRHFKSAVLSLMLTFSFSLITSQAVARTDLGLLKQKNSWKIGTVNAADGTIYCAMVNKFSDDTILAFSRNQIGQDSVAVDFKNNLFTTGVKYFVSLSSGGRNKNNFSARANSNRSLVIDLGIDSNFYDYFQYDKVLTLSSSEVKAAFKLNRFHASYAVLLDCAGGLNQGPKISAIAVKNVQKASLNSNKYKDLEKSMQDDFIRQDEENIKKIQNLTLKEKEILAKLTKKKQKVSRMKKLSENQKKSLIAALESKKRLHNYQYDLSNKKINSSDVNNISNLKEKNLKTQLLLQKKKVLSLENKFENQKNLKYNLNQSQKQQHNLVLELDDQKKKVIQIKRASELKQKDLLEALSIQKEKVKTLSSKNNEQRKARKNLNSAEKKQRELLSLLKEQKKKLEELESKYSAQEDIQIEIKSAQKKQLDIMKKLVLQRQLIIASKKIEPEYDRLKNEQNNLENSLNIQKKEVKKLEALYGIESQYKNKLRLAKAEQEKIKKDLKEQKNKVNKFKEIYNRKNIGNYNVNYNEKLRSQKEKVSNIESSLREEQNNILEALALNLEVESFGFSGNYGDNFDSEFKSILKQHKHQISDKVLKLKKQKQLIMNQLLEQKKKVFNLQQRYESQKYAKESLEAEIKLRDKEIEKLKYTQAKNLTLIEDLTRQKRQIIYKENEAGREQKDLIEKLNVQERKVRNLEVKYNKQTASMASLKRDLEQKKREISQIKVESDLKEDVAFNRVSNSKNELAAKVLSLKRKNSKIEAELVAARREVMAVEQEFNSSPNKYVADRDLSRTLEQQVRKSTELAQSFIDAKNIYERKFFKLQSERKKLREKVEFLELENKDTLNKKENIETSDSINRKKIKELESRMLSMAKQRSDMQDRIDTQEMQNKLLDVALKAKEQELSSVNLAATERSKHLEALNKEKSKNLAIVNSEISKLENNRFRIIGNLKLKLESQEEKYKELKVQFDKRMSLLPDSDKLMVEFDMKEETLSRLKRQLSLLELKRIDALERASKARDSLTLTNRQKNIGAIDLKTGKLSRAQADYLGRLSKAQNERNKLKKRLDDLVYRNVPFKKKVVHAKSSLAVAKQSLSELELQLASAGQERQELSDLLSEQMKWDINKIKSLEDRESELLSILAIKTDSVDDRRQLADVQFKLSNIKASKIKSIGITRKKLNKKIARYNELEKEFDRQSKIFPSANKIAKQLTSKSKEVTRLKFKLKKLENKLKSVTFKAANAQQRLALTQEDFINTTNKQIKDSEQLADSLSETRGIYKNKIISLKVELSNLKVRLADAVAGKIPLMTEKEKIKSELELSKNKILKIEKEVYEAKKQKQKLANRVEEQNKKLVLLKAEAEQNDKALPLNFRNAAELASKKEEVSLLEQQLAGARIQYSSAVEEASNVKKKLASIIKENNKSVEGSNKKLTEAESELYKLKIKISDIEGAAKPILADKNRAETELYRLKDKLSYIEEELIVVGQEKMDLSVRLEDQNYEISALNDDLASREDEMFYIQDELEALRYAADESNNKFMSTQDEMEALKDEYSSVVNDLVYQLNNKIAQYDGLKKEYEDNIRFAPSRKDMEDNLNYIDSLERELSDVNSEKLEAANDAIQAKKDLERSKLQLSSLKIGLKSDDAQFALMQKSLEKQQQALNNIIRAQNFESTSKQKTLISPEFKKVSSDKIIRKAEIPFERAYKEKLRTKPLLRSYGQRSIISQPIPRERPKLSKKPLNRATDFLNKIMSYHRPGAIPEEIAPIGGRHYKPKKSLSDIINEPKLKSVENIREVLSNSNVSITNFIPIEQTEYSIISQWNNADSNISGMYENRAIERGFRSQVNEYISRYRDDCDGGLIVRISSSQKVRAGTIITSDLECNMPSNSYANSIVFLENKDGFNSILHTGYISKKYDVKNIRDRIVRTLKKINSFSVPYSTQSKINQKEYKFNIPATRKPAHISELETVVIQ